MYGCAENVRYQQHCVRVWLTSRQLCMQPVLQNSTCNLLCRIVQANNCAVLYMHVGQRGFLAGRQYMHACVQSNDEGLHASDQVFR